MTYHELSALEPGDLVSTDYRGGHCTGTVIYVGLHVVIEWDGGGCTVIDPALGADPELVASLTKL